MREEKEEGKKEYRIIAQTETDNSLQLDYGLMTFEDACEAAKIIDALDYLPEYRPIRVMVVDDRYSCEHASFIPKHSKYKN